MPDESRAETWRARGASFAWAPASGAPAVDVFHVETGPPDAPVLVLVHGFPTCSIDWFELAELLTDRYRVCALDFPGYGYSAKPRGWGYSLARDAELLSFYVSEVLGTDRVIVMGHDRGSSVALGFALAAEGPARIEHLVLTNGNIYLPLSNLTAFQRLVLDPEQAPAVLGALTPAALAAGMGSTTFSPPRGPGDPEVDALAATFAHAGGVEVLHETIQYLRERAEHERGWLEALAARDLPTTIIWGTHDTISPPRVATHVWSEHLMLKPGRNRLYLVPGANHYLQVDHPDEVAAALLHTLDPGSGAAPGPIGPQPGAPLLVDASRPSMPTATDVLQLP